jgi:hypothetical protein
MTRQENGRVIVETLNPKLVAEIPGNPVLAPIAEEARLHSQAAFDSVTSDSGN